MGDNIVTLTKNLLTKSSLEGLDKLLANKNGTVNEL